MKHNSKAHLNRWWLLVPVLVSAILCVSCREEYFYDEREPEWLGESIYDYLSEQNKYTNFIRLIDELGYKEVLEKTGSKTLFVVDDETFKEFFADNRWGVKSYEEFSMQQKEQILYSSMLNNVFFTHMLGNNSNEEKDEGMALRRTSALSALSTYSVVSRSQFPNNYYWSKDLIKSDSIILLQDNTASPMVVFTNSYAENNSLKGSDYAFIANLKDTSYVYYPADVFVNGVLVAEPNIKCKNGVVHRLDKLITPLTNMAEVVCTDGSTQLFGKLLDRFSAPFLSTNDQFSSPVYVKKYFTTRGHTMGLEKFNTSESNVSFMTTPTDSAVETGLKFDPGWNTLTASDVKPMSVDMSAMFVPTDTALNDFLRNGSGKFLYDCYGGWDGIPDRVLADLLNNHMKSSFANTVPSKFEQVKNDAQRDMGVKEGDVQKTILCSNGVVYVTDKVYAPVSYVAVTAPTLVNDNMNVMRWAIEKCGFLAYLYSMDSYYSFLLPTDNNFWYLDPLSVAKGAPEYWKFQYNTDHKSVEVLVYDSLRKTEFSSRRMQAWKSGADEDMILNRLEDLIDQHIIVDTIADAVNGKHYYLTKGNGTVKVMPNTTKETLVLPNGTTIDPLNIYAGHQLETESVIALSAEDISLSENGRTYVLPSLAQSSLKSAYDMMKAQAGDESNQGPFYQFFKLMKESDVYSKDDTYATSGELTLDVFNTYHYTIYVPSNEAVLKAIDAGLPTVEKAKEFLESFGEDELSDEVKETYLNKVKSIVRDFVCYHIHDNSVYIGGSPIRNKEYQTSVLDTVANIFRRLKVSADNSSLTIVDEAKGVHHVNVVPDKEGKLYNVMSRDYLFNDGVSGILMKEEVSEETNIEISKHIETSSFAVIHGIDGVLLYDNAQLAGYKTDVEDAGRDVEESINK